MAKNDCSNGHGLPAQLPALIKAFLDQLRDFERMEGELSMPTAMRRKRPAAASSARGSAPEFRGGSESYSVEADLIRRAHKKRDGIL